MNSPNAPVTAPLAVPVPNDWTLIIEPKGRVFDLRLRELWQYRDLVYLFVWRDFVAQYKQTVLGPVWHVLQPILTTVVFTVVFGRIVGISTEGAPPFLFFMAGSLLWTYFSGVFSATSTTFTSNAHLFGKVYFPRLAVPIATLFSRLIGLGIQMLFFVGFLAWYSWRGAPVTPNAWLLAVPLLLLLCAAFSLGLGVIISAFTTRYRDLAVVATFGTQLLMFATPIIYPLSAVPSGWREWLALNPLAPIVELFRHAFLGTGTPDVAMLGVSAVSISVVLFAGVVLFTRVERSFMDTV